MKLIRLNNTRQPKVVTSRGNGGNCYKYSPGPYPNIYDIVRETSGKTYYLARTNWIVSKIAWKLASEGVLFRHLDSAKEKFFGWSKSWTKTMNRILASYSPRKTFMRFAETNNWKQWRVDFFKNYLHYKGIDPGAITNFIGTIHSAKGREADTVVLFNDITRRVLDSIAIDSEEERRVWYVGMTRAREKLILPDSFFAWHTNGLVYPIFQEI